MDYIIIIVGRIVFTLCLVLKKYIKLSKHNKKLKSEIDKVRENYNNVLYDNCILEDKIEKIRSLNLIDYSNNDYYRELLTINK